MLLPQPAAPCLPQTAALPPYTAVLGATNPLFSKPCLSVALLCHTDPLPPCPPHPASPVPPLPATSNRWKLSFKPKALWTLMGHLQPSRARWCAIGERCLVRAQFRHLHPFIPVLPLSSLGLHTGCLLRVIVLHCLRCEPATHQYGLLAG